jgi:uncharacterized protein (TIGR03435 family)
VIGGRDIKMDSLISTIARVAGRLLVDRTGLRVPIDFKLEWTPEANDPLAGFDREALTNGVFPRISFQQAVKEQLGMKLEATKAPVSVFVVDAVQRPSEN